MLLHIDGTINVQLEGPLAKLYKDDVPSAVGVDVFEGGIGIFDLDTQLLDGGEDLLELSAVDAAVVADIDFIEDTPHLEEDVDVAQNEAELGSLDEYHHVVNATPVTVWDALGLGLGVRTHEDGGQVVGKAVEGKDLAGKPVDIVGEDESVGVGIELIEESLAGCNILGGGAAAGKLQTQLGPGSGEVTFFLGAEVKILSAAALIGGARFTTGSTAHIVLI